ncbi:fumarylacetoacetate hydrolase family protein [Aldersonia sp. NBC_00410]|uniref:fumarylacetoacetate hydrolase family protein n=1 Tax=Aldersonia sp. NBC_00410 TaxID=2975954 RepID=UPI0022526D35|nr:fumarylacetoacetate hydrolase family protein [Aldersonia sp. NBC_00410]MCX5042380.1 fumarylacetoacetate hydrolase family protein [Aldersonia sp. NBC_00410]
MRIVNQHNRLGLITAAGVVDVNTASGGRFPSDPSAIFAQWRKFRQWALEAPDGPVTELDATALGPPVPRPPQVFAIGLNYRDHAAEAGLELPATPQVFTKFPGSVTGPTTTIDLPSAAVDFEAELVVVIGLPTRHVESENAWSHVAGLTIGQDLSDRVVQLKPPAPAQFSLGKSFAGFAPIGPVLVTPDEFADPDDLEIGCTLSGEQMQKARTSDFIFSIPDIIAYLSAVLPLFPGDLIFTGTPAGVGWAREPKRLITARDELLTYVENIGHMRHRFRDAPPSR